MSEIVLVRPGVVNPGEAHWNESLPLGIGYLAAAVRARGIDVSIVDGKLQGHTSIDDTARAIISLRPEVVGFTAMTVEYPSVVQIARRVKASDVCSAIILGGVHANAVPVESLTDSDCFDYVLRGEGERTLPCLIQAIQAGEDVENIPGISFRQGNGFRGSSPSWLSDQDFASLPFPAWDLFPRQKVYPIMAERGCPYSCVFCSRNMTQRVRSRPAGHVMDEIRWLHKEFAPEWIYFEDETFGLKPGPTEVLLNSLAEFNRHAGIRFKAQTRVDKVTPSMARLMKQANFEYIELGIESGDPEVLARSGKGIELGQIERSVTILKRAGLKVWLKFIIGLPGDTRDSVKRTIHLSVKLNPDRLSVAVIVPYPGSRIYEFARNRENGYRLLTEDWHRFDKYLGACVELDTLRYSTMRRLQVQMYLETYLRNARFKPLARMILNNRSFLFSYLKLFMFHS